MFFLLRLLLFGLNVELHGADFFNGALEVIAVLKLADAGGRAGRDKIPRTQRQAARQQADVFTQAADHVAGVRGHDLFAVLQYSDGEISRSPISSLVTIHGPRPLNVSTPFPMLRVLGMRRP